MWYIFLNCSEKSGSTEDLKNNLILLFAEHFTWKEMMKRKDERDYTYCIDIPRNGSWYQARLHVSKSKHYKPNILYSVGADQKNIKNIKKWNAFFLQLGALLFKHCVVPYLYNIFVAKTFNCETYTHNHYKSQKLHRFSSIWLSQV